MVPVMNATREGDEGLEVEAESGSDLKSPKNKSTSSVPDLGKALRTVYDDTLREDVPSDFMDLLSKLS
jgi:Anti-sigma factor NepR